jgi:BirA family biotin operon repressor/biotin-[acetyl-CoA-carboxylase] ligase
MALAVRDALAGFTTGELLIKWPNDVLAPTGKLAGILVELKQEHAIVGIGVNVNRPSEGAFESAGYLDDGLPGHVSHFGREEVATALINSILTYYAEWQTAAYSFEPFVAQYEASMSLLGEQVCVRDIRGGELANGVVQGIDGSGQLLLVGAEGTIKVFAGEITLRSQ